MNLFDMYAHLLTYDDPDEIAAKAVGERAGVNPKAVDCLIGLLKTNANLYQKLLDAGYTGVQVLDWVRRPVAGAGKGVKCASGADEVLNMSEKTCRTPTL